MRKFALRFASLARRPRAFHFSCRSRCFSSTPHSQRSQIPALRRSSAALRRRTLPRAASRPAQPRSRVPQHRPKLPLLLERRCALLGNRRLCRPCGLGLGCRGLVCLGARSPRKRRLRSRGSWVGIVPAAMHTCTITVRPLHAQQQSSDAGLTV